MKIYSKSVPHSMKILLASIRGGRVLDVGGAHLPERANQIAARVEEVVLLDLQMPVRDVATNVTLAIQSVESIDESIGEFDHIVMSNVLEHLDDPDSGFRAASKCIKKGGMMHVLSPNCETLNRRIGLAMGLISDLRTVPEKEIPIGHKHMLNVADVKGFIEGAGLVLEACKGILLKPVPTPEMIQWPEERIQAFFEIAEQMPPEICHEVYFRARKP